MGATEIPFDPIITLIVFLISVPALVLQSMPSDVRRIFFERSKWKNHLIRSIAVPFICSLIVLVIGIWVEFHRKPTPDFHTILWIVVLSVVIIALILVAIYFPLKYSRRQGVLKLLEQDTLKFLDSKGRIQEENIEDILDLGKNAESLQEKNLMLQVIHSIVVNTCNNNSYSGDSFETLILRLHEVVMVDSGSANLESFRMVAEIFQEIAIARREIPHMADIQHTVKATGSLGRAALANLEFGLEADNIVMSLIQTLGLINYIKPLDVTNSQHSMVMTDVSEALFDIGSLAAEYNRHFISVAALDKLVVMLSQLPLSGSLPKYILDELTADVIGLMAHIWSKDKGRREFVQRRMPEVRAFLGMPDSMTLKNARVHYLDKSQFETVKRIDEMSKGSSPKRKLSKMKK